MGFWPVGTSSNFIHDIICGDAISDVSILSIVRRACPVISIIKLNIRKMCFHVV